MLAGKDAILNYMKDLESAISTLTAVSSKIEDFKRKVTRLKNYTYHQPDIDIYIRNILTGSASISTSLSEIRIEFDSQDIIIVSSSLHEAPSDDTSEGEETKLPDTLVREAEESWSYICSELEKLPAFPLKEEFIGPHWKQINALNEPNTQMAAEVLMTENLSPLSDHLQSEISRMQRFLEDSDRRQPIITKTLVDPPQGTTSTPTNTQVSPGAEIIIGGQRTGCFLLAEKVSSFGLSVIPGEFQGLPAHIEERAAILAQTEGFPNRPRYAILGHSITGTGEDVAVNFIGQHATYAQYVESWEGRHDPNPETGRTLFQTYQEKPGESAALSLSLHVGIFDPNGIVMATSRSEETRLSRGLLAPSANLGLTADHLNDGPFYPIDVAYRAVEERLGINRESVHVNGTAYVVTDNTNHPTVICTGQTLETFDTINKRFKENLPKHAGKTRELIPVPVDKIPEFIGNPDLGKPGSENSGWVPITKATLGLAAIKANDKPES